MQNVIAFANNDVISIAWTYGKKLTGCMGFAVYRVDPAGKEEPLPAVAVFEGFARKPGQTCKEFPIQKFYWKDVYARLVAERTGNRRFRYKVVPMTGTKGHLVPMHIPHVLSNEVEISPDVGAHVRAYFNRGLISTQRISRAFKGKPSKGSLLDRVAKKTDALRASLSGDMVEALTEFVARAAKSGKIYAALYELHDQELIDALKGLGQRLNIVLSNSMKDVPVGKTPAGATKPKTKKVDDNADARDALAKTTKAKWDRILPNNQIGHNKFLVYVNAQGTPKAVLFGSTNWTSTGLCTQTNNSVVVDDGKVAQRYLDYWNKLKADTAQAKGVGKALQAGVLRGWDATSKRLALPQQDALTSWFSPNTPKLRGKNTATEKRPPDMQQVRSLILGAKRAVLFLAFYPGSPSVANWAAEAQRADKALFVRGCVTNKSASEGFYYSLRGSEPPKLTVPKGQKKPPKKQDPRVIAAEAFDKVVPPGWLKEILSAGFAIIHDKIVVIDPFSDDDCVVITGSHNLGHKASYNNDENLAIIKGNRRLAEAYATHVLDVYDHFAWRYMVNHGRRVDQYLKEDPDVWQSWYFDEHGAVKVAQLRFWLSALS